MFKDWSKEALIAAAVALCSGIGSLLLVAYRIGGVEAQVAAVASDLQLIKEALLGHQNEQASRHVAEGR